MDKTEFGVKFITEGFKPSEIRPAKMWSKLQEDFVTLYNEYCEVTNATMEQLNKAWSEAHPGPETDESKDKTAEETRIEELQDEVDNWAYGCYMRDAFDLAAFMVNQKYPESYLSGFIFMDGPNPVFGARIKQHPEMSMHFVIESK